MIFVAFMMGIVFLYTGKIRSVIFDLREDTLTMKKRNTFCDRRSIVTYRLDQITDIKGVYRGSKFGNQYDTQRYYIIAEFESNRFVDEKKDSDFESEEESNSSEEAEILEKRLRRMKQEEDD